MAKTEAARSNAKAKGSAQTRADLMLLLLAFCWGVAYAMMGAVLADIPTFTLIAYRFLGSLLLLVLFFFKRCRGASATTWKYALLVGLCLFGAYVGATLGVQQTSLSNTGFLAGLAVVTAPLLDFLIRRRVPSKKLFFVLCLCVVGTGLMTLNKDLHFASGDLWALFCAAAYGADLVVTGVAVEHEEVDPFQLGVLSIGITGLFALVAAVLLESPALPQSGMTWVYLVFLIVFCTALPFVVQPIAQQYTSPAHAGVIFTLEPVFGAIVAYFAVHERLLPRGYLGASLLLVSMVFLEMELPRRRSKAIGAEGKKAGK